ncbi:MAG: PQQ-dependent sugar dehydrogenase [Actinomycetota bacterium]
MELPRKLPARLAALVLGLPLAAVVLIGCVADDGTATIGQESGTETTLPSTTAPAANESGDDAAAETTDDEAAGTDGADETEAASGPTTTLPPLQGLGTDVVAEGFDQPILVTGAPGTDALFVVEREGVIRTVVDGEIADEPFLDLRDRLLSSSIEQGLLGLAFHPDYADNGRLFAYWTDPDGDSMLAEFTATDPIMVDPDSMSTVLQIDQPAERHNAGMLLFGPDGLLYVSVGDGGSGGSTSQDTSNLLGTILRLDVDAVGPDPYAVPDGNPFGDEIWAYGLRNPWRFSIDPGQELMYIGDVGQEAFEELNIVSLDGAGTNFGWFTMEGDRCFRAGCDTDGLTDPTFQYGRDDGCSITGGWVYRGAAIPEFDGHYFYADWCTGFVRSLRYDGSRISDQFDWTDDFGLGQVTSFGLDNDGELYVVTWDGGLHRIVARR